MAEVDVDLGGRTVRVRDVGDADWPAVVYFHGLPSSRLGPAFGDAEAAGVGVRVVSFDRPGFGLSQPVRYSLTSIGADTGRIADALGIDRFASLGFSMGGPYALAAAAVHPERVRAVGILSGLGPFDEVPGALEELEDGDHRARALLPDRPQEAAAVISEMFADMVTFDGDGQAILSWLDEQNPDGAADEVAVDPAFRPYLAATIGEAMRQGDAGGVNDNLAVLPPWDFSLRDVECPVWLWYSSGDSDLGLAHGEHLASQVRDPRLVVWEERSHFAHVRHWPDVLLTLTRVP